MKAKEVVKAVTGCTSPTHEHVTVQCVHCFAAFERNLRRKIAREIREFSRNHEAIDSGMERAIESCARIAIGKKGKS